MFNFEEVNHKDVVGVRQLLALGTALSDLSNPYVKAAGIYTPVEQLGNIVGRSPDEVMVVFVSIILFVICLPLPWIRSVSVRKFYATSWGVVMGFFAFGVSFWLFIGFVLLAWLQMRLLPWRVASASMMIVGFSLLLLRSLYGWFEGNNADINDKTIC